MARKDLLTRLADAGEEAFTKLGESPGMDRMFGFANSTRERLDELTRRVSGIGDLERRLARLEQRVDVLSPETAAEAVVDVEEGPAAEPGPTVEGVWVPEGSSADPAVEESS